MFATQVIFGVNGQKYSFNSLYVRAVEHSCNIVMLPGAPECVVGVTELRGEWIPICDLNIKFKTGVPAKPNRDIIYVNYSQGCIGCLVDMVHEIGAVTEDIQMKLPTILQSDETSYVEGIVRHKGELVTAIHHECVLTPNEAAQLSAAMKSLLKKKQDEQDALLAAEAAKKEAEEKAAKDKEE
ncbi:MAG: chemotaxis protein CheW [Lachnospiraceae bacterium]|nr:chemotaxis protein CheW [Lachnospiraceae bacterium]